MTSTELSILLAAITALIGAISKFIIDMYKLRQDMKTMSGNILKIEHATNSMKDALVAAALDRGRLEGAETERDDESRRSEVKKISEKDSEKASEKGSEHDPIHVEIKDKTKK